MSLLVLTSRTDGPDLGLCLVDGIPNSVDIIQSKTIGAFLVSLLGYPVVATMTNSIQTAAWVEFFLLKAQSLFTHVTAFTLVGGCLLLLKRPLLGAVLPLSFLLISLDVMIAFSLLLVCCL